MNPACNPGRPRRSSSLSSRWRDSSSGPDRRCLPNTSLLRDTEGQTAVYTEVDPKAGSFCAGSIYVGTWLSLVEHSLGVRGVGSSNLPVPTSSDIRSSFPCKILVATHEAP